MLTRSDCVYWSTWVRAERELPSLTTSNSSSTAPVDAVTASTAPGRDRTGHCSLPDPLFWDVACARWAGRTELFRETGPDTAGARQQTSPGSRMKVKLRHNVVELAHQGLLTGRVGVALGVGGLAAPLAEVGRGAGQAGDLGDRRVLGQVG